MNSEVNESFNKLTNASTQTITNEWRPILWSVSLAVLENEWIDWSFGPDDYFRRFSGLMSWDSPSARSPLDVQTLASAGACEKRSNLLFKSLTGAALRSIIDISRRAGPARAGSIRPSKHAFVFSLPPRLQLLSDGFRGAAGVQVDFRGPQDRADRSLEVSGARKKIKPVSDYFHITAEKEHKKKWIPLNLLNT